MDPRVPAQRCDPAVGLPHGYPDRSLRRTRRSRPRCQLPPIAAAVRVRRYEPDPVTTRSRTRRRGPPRGSESTPPPKKPYIAQRANNESGADLDLSDHPPSEFAAAAWNAFRSTAITEPNRHTTDADDTPTHPPPSPHAHPRQATTTRSRFGTTSFAVACTPSSGTSTTSERFSSTPSTHGSSPRPTIRRFGSGTGSPGAASAC